MPDDRPVAVIDLAFFTRLSGDDDERRAARTRAGPRQSGAHWHTARKAIGGRPSLARWSSHWEARAEQFMSLEHRSQERALHPALLRLIEHGSGERLLDYGCGDGRILEKLSDRWQIDAYDPSEQMRLLAKRRVGAKLHRLVSNVGELSGFYDVIILGMVLLVLPRVEDVRRVLRECAHLMAQTSRLFVTTTHPCFRTFDFSNVSTSFGRAQPFSYMADGTPFEVTVRDPGTNGVTFTDFHWSLGFTFNMLRVEGLSIVAMVEVPDDPGSPNRNILVPPFLIMECRRSL